MFLLDTNVVSAMHPRRAERDPAVANWMLAQPLEILFLSAVTIWELEEGVMRVSRRDALQGARLRTWLDETLAAFALRIISFDQSAAQRCATLHVPDRRSLKDAMIAATALTKGWTVVTRNVKDFAPMGVPLLNPWESVQ